MSTSVRAIGNYSANFNLLPIRRWAPVNTPHELIWIRNIGRANRQWCPTVTLSANFDNQTLDIQVRIARFVAEHSLAGDVECRGELEFRRDGIDHDPHLWPNFGIGPRLATAIKMPEGEPILAILGGVITKPADVRLGLL